MIAVIELGGNQFTVKKGDIIDVKKVAYDVDDTFTTEALLVSDEEGKDTKIGTPFVDGVKVEVKVVEHFRAEKVRVFKMKSKKRHMKNKGFKAHMTKIEVLNIG